MNFRVLLARRLWFASVIVLIGLMGSFSALTAQSTGVSQPTPDFAAIDAYVEAERRSLGIPGLALGIVHDDQIVHLQGFGVAGADGRVVTPQTPFYIGSVTKSFTALAILQLVEVGKLDLDAPVQTILPWFGVTDEQASRQITVRHLLTQTSGFSTQTGNRFWNQQDMEADVRQLNTMRLSQPVGQEFQYSNINYTIAGLVVEQVSGQTYADYIHQHIFAPLVMRYSFASGEAAQAAGVAMGHTYHLGRIMPDAGMQPPGYLPAGFLAASAEDMTHYLIAQLNNGRFGVAAVLSAAGMATLHQPVAPGLAADSAYGMGWVVGPTNGVETIWHNGDDTRNHAIVILVPDSQWGIVLLANAAGYELSVGVDDVAKGVLNLVLGQQPPAPSVFQSLMKGVYWGVLLTPFLEIIGIAWGVRQLRRWRKRVGVGQVHWSWVRLGWHLLGSILPNLLVAWLFLWGLPQVTGIPLSGLVRLTPDFGVALVAAGVLGLGWSIARTVWIGLMLRTAQHHSGSDRQAASASA